MKTVYLTGDEGLAIIDEAQVGVWIDMVDPRSDECECVAAAYNIELGDLMAALDLEERSRVSTEEGYTQILVDVPALQEHEGRLQYITLPLGIIRVADVIITTCLEETAVLAPFKNGTFKGFSTQLRSRFIFQILYRNASVYLQYLREINRRSDEVEHKLHKSTRNAELIELLELQKSIVYFNTSLRQGEVVLNRLLGLDALKKYPDDEELLEDTIIETQQAIEMGDIYGNILSSTMDAYASVISNNQNSIMKALAMVTIIMSIPTMVFSAYGMNVSTAGMPLADVVWGFWAIIAAAFCLSAVSIVFFFIRRWF
jgi:magnesium transporter